MRILFTSGTKVIFSVLSIELPIYNEQWRAWRKYLLDYIQVIKFALFLISMSASEIMRIYTRTTIIARLLPLVKVTDFSLLKKLSEEYSVKASEEWDPKLKISSQGVQKWIPDGIKVNGRPKATGVLATINSCLYYSPECPSEPRANGIPLPPELLNETMRKDLEAAAVAEWFNGYLGTTQFFLTNEKKMKRTVVSE